MCNYGGVVTENPIVRTIVPLYKHPHSIFLAVLKTYLSMQNNSYTFIKHNFILLHVHSQVTSNNVQEKIHYVNKSK